MSWNKREIVTAAFEEVGLGAYVYSQTADDLQSAMRKLDSIMAEWTSKGIVFDPVYPQPVSFSGGDLDADTNAPDDTIQPMILALAIRISPAYGKTPSPDTRTAAVHGYNTVLGQYVVGTEMSLAGMPLGAGHKSTRDPFFR